MHQYGDWVFDNAGAPIVYPLFGHAFTLAQNLGITAIFTVVSILRGYAVRRWFNARIKRLVTLIASQRDKAQKGDPCTPSKS